MNFRTLDLNLLRVFDMVMIERNVTRAAQRLAMTQPAVSNALRRLRAAIDEELFIPGAGGMTPTPHAVVLWPAVRDSLARLRELFDPQVFDPKQDARSFTLAMADATAAVLVPRLTAALVQGRTQVDLRIEPLTTRDPRSALERGAFDAAIGFFPDVARALAAAGGQEDQVLSPLYGCEYVCVMRSGHVLAAKPELALYDFCAADHVRVSFAGRPHGFVDESLAEIGRERRIVLTINQFATAAQVVLQSDLLGVFPRSFVPVSGVAEGLAIRALPIEMPRLEIGLLWHRRHERDPAHRWLRETIQQLAQGPACEPQPTRPQRARSTSNSVTGLARLPKALRA